jgi:Tfp pilus assembly protein PilE
MEVEHGNKTCKMISNSANNNIDGYSLIELVVVAAGIATLAAIATPSVITFVQEGRADEAKALINTAAAECIREANQSGAVVADIIPQTFKREDPESKLPWGYSFVGDTKGGCGMIAIEDKNKESHLPTYAAEICNVNLNDKDPIKAGMCWVPNFDPITEKGPIGIVKHSEYKDDTAFTKNECIRWATSRAQCYSTPGEIDKLIALGKNRAEILRNKAKAWAEFAEAKNNKFTGQFKREIIDLDVWLLNGVEMVNKQAYDDAIAAIEKAKNEAEYKNWLAGPPPGDGPNPLAAKGVGQWGAFEGVAVSSEAEYTAKQREKQKFEFEAAVQNAKNSKYDGLVEKNGFRMYTWNGKEFETEADWQKARAQPAPQPAPQPDATPARTAMDNPNMNSPSPITPARTAMDNPNPNQNQNPQNNDVLMCRDAMGTTYPCTASSD